MTKLTEKLNYTYLARLAKLMKLIIPNLLFGGCPPTDEKLASLYAKKIYQTGDLVKSQYQYQHMKYVVLGLQFVHSEQFLLTWRQFSKLFHRRFDFSTRSLDHVMTLLPQHKAQEVASTPGANPSSLRKPIRKWNELT